ncbi:hypothetical protein [Spirosoma rigui]|uniref:hypothetical protein n=1 Tax=Spirosoma rigui TaxID=564064 RepID=UPI0012D34AD0|nr:hypothetical protein [Spirosoma rigui]
MRLYSYHICASLLAGLLACAPAEPDVQPPGTSKATGISDVSRGDITGFVTLCDEFGVTKSKSDSMIVSLEGLQTAFPVRTRPEGRFVIANAYAGRYNLSYNKPDYGNYKLIGIQHSGSIQTIVPSVTIWERPKTAPSNLAVTVDGLKLVLSGLSTPIQPVGTVPEKQRRIRIFFGRDEKVSQLNYVTTLDQTIIPPGGTGAFAAKLLADDLLAFKPGDRVYAIAYGITAFENAYDDPDTKQKLYTGINPVPSNVVSFVLP